MSCDSSLEVQIKKGIFLGFFIFHLKSWLVCSRSLGAGPFYSVVYLRYVQRIYL